MTSTPVSDDAPSADAALPLLGMLAYGQLAAFTRLATDSAEAPNLGQRLALSRLAALALARLDLVEERIDALGGEIQPLMQGFAGVLNEFDARTVPSTWWERLLRGYVGYGIADDFVRIAAAGVDSGTRELAENVLVDSDHAQLVVDTLAVACRAEPTLASRLALWGRRLVGESLGAVQGTLASHPEIARLLGGMERGDEVQQRLFARLTAEHSRRMGRLGLTP